MVAPRTKAQVSCFPTVSNPFSCPWLLFLLLSMSQAAFFTVTSADCIFAVGGALESTSLQEAQYCIVLLP